MLTERVCAAIPGLLRIPASSDQFDIKRKFACSIKIKRKDRLQLLNWRREPKFLTCESEISGSVYGLQTTGNDQLHLRSQGTIKRR